MFSCTASPGSEEEEKQMGTKRKQGEVNMGDQSSSFISPSQQHPHSACVVRYTRDEKPLHYTTKIQSFSLLKAALAKSQCDRYESQSFNAGGYKWRLALYPNGDVKRNGKIRLCCPRGCSRSRTADFLSLYLMFDGFKEHSQSFKVYAEFEIAVLSQLEDNFWFELGGKSFGTGTHKFYGVERSQGTHKRAALASSNRDKYESQPQPALASLQDNSLKLVYGNAYLRLGDSKTRRFHAMKTQWGFEKLVSLGTFNDASYGFLVGDYCAFGVDIFIMKFDGKRETLSLIKQPNNYKFTWKSNDFSQQNETCYKSEAFTCSGELTVGSSKASSGYLSPYLLFDSFKELPQETGCNFADFILLSDLKEPKKGFIHNDSIIVEVFALAKAKRFSNV
ncbi:unnamed protein product [Citrullus colocynthis]|uniref:MATH domain-containing protein n=1 Tax=Citrullus colocynthis TaxID=252529 RepID=A0ABP0XXK2_9ROSI